MLLLLIVLSLQQTVTAAVCCKNAFRIQMVSIGRCWCLRSLPMRSSFPRIPLGKLIFPFSRCFLHVNIAWCGNIFFLNLVQALCFYNSKTLKGFIWITWQGDEPKALCSNHLTGWWAKKAYQVWLNTRSRLNRVNLAACQSRVFGSFNYAISGF